MTRQTIKENKLLEDIKNTCSFCKECDPCCTGNIMKRCIENKRYTGIINYKKTSNAETDYKI